MSTNTRGNSGRTIIYAHVYYTYPDKYVVKYIARPMSIHENAKDEGAQENPLPWGGLSAALIQIYIYMHARGRDERGICNAGDKHATQALQLLYFRAHVRMHTLLVVPAIMREIWGSKEARGKRSCEICEFRGAEEMMMM